MVKSAPGCRHPSARTFLGPAPPLPQRHCCPKHLSTPHHHHPCFARTHFLWAPRPSIPGPVRQHLPRPPRPPHSPEPPPSGAPSTRTSSGPRTPPVLRPPNRGPLPPCALTSWPSPCVPLSLRGPAVLQPQRAQSHIGASRARPAAGPWRSLVQAERCFPLHTALRRWEERCGDAHRKSDR